MASFINKFSPAALLLLLNFVIPTIHAEELPSGNTLADAEKYCERQVKADQFARSSKWFTHWLECKQERVMPFEIKANPSKEQDIREMYDRLLVLGVNVDMGLSPVQTVYKEWDQMLHELRIKDCLIRMENKDGSSRCINQ